MSSQELKIAEEHPTSVVVGMGTAGLSAAFALLTQGHNVTLIDNRDESSLRPQRVFLPENIVKLIFGFTPLPNLGYKLVFKPNIGFEIALSTPEPVLDPAQQFDLDFFKNLAHSNSAIALRELENYFLIKLKEAVKLKKIKFHNVDFNEKANQAYRNMREEYSKHENAAGKLQAEIDDSIQTFLRQSRENFENDLKQHTEAMQAILLDPKPQALFKNTFSSLPQYLKDLAQKFIEKQREYWRVFYEIEFMSACKTTSALEQHQAKQSELACELDNYFKKTLDVLELLNSKKPNEYEYPLLLRIFQSDVGVLNITFKSTHSNMGLLMHSSLINFQIAKLKVTTDSSIALGTLNKQLHSLQKTLPTHPFVMLVPEVNLELSGELTIMRGSQYAVTELDGNTQVVKVYDKSQNKTREIPFDHFVAADGSKHQMVTLLGKSNPEKFAVTYKPLAKPRQINHAILVLKLKENFDCSQIDSRVVTRKIPGSSKMKETDVKRFKELGWNKSYLPIVFLDFNKKGKECYCVCEIPETLSEAKEQHEKLQAWAELISKIEFGLEKSQIDSLQFASVFPISPHCADKNFLELGKKGTFFIVGDACLSANVLFGHGIYNAIMDSISLRACFSMKDSIVLELVKARFIETQQDYQILYDEFLKSLNDSETNSTYTPLLQSTLQATHGLTVDLTGPRLTDPQHLANRPQT